MTARIPTPLAVPAVVPPRHLVAVWDPSRAQDVLGAHVTLLLDEARRAGTPDADDVYVWWGKIRSSNRQRPLPHLADVVALDRSLGERGLAREMHLYLTDYRSLYVAHVGEITDQDVRLDDARHVPAAVYPPEVNCDCWFMLHDIRRLVLDDTVAVIAELRKLANTAYADRPVSLYGGMVDLPLIVTRRDNARWFDPAARSPYTDGRLWAEFDAEHTGLGATERDLRENLLGEDAWSGLEPAARTFVATAERVLRDHRGDPAFDFSPVVVNLTKAFEVQVNALLRASLGGLPYAQRLANVNGTSMDVGRGAPLSVGQLARAIAEERAINDAVRRRLKHGEWMAVSLPPILAELAEWRNPAAHGERVGREDAVRLRDGLVGVGCMGALVELGRVRVM